MFTQQAGPQTNTVLITQKITFISYRNVILSTQSHTLRDYGFCVADPLRSGYSGAPVQLLLRLRNSSNARVRRSPAERDGRGDREKSRAPAGGPETFHASQLDCSTASRPGGPTKTGQPKSDESLANPGVRGVIYG